MKEAITDVEQNKFSEFSKKIKTSLEDKLRNNPTMKAQQDKFKHIEDIKNAFKAISDKQTAHAAVTNVDDIPDRIDPTLTSEE